MAFSTVFRPLDDMEAAARWESLWTASPQRTAYATLAYGRAAAAASGLTAELLLADDEDGQTVAGALVFSRRRGPFREVTLPPFTPFTPLLFRTPLSEADVHAKKTPADALLDALDDRFDAVRLHLHPASDDVRPMQWCGWTASPLYTYRLALTDEATLMAGWSSSTRRRFRKARAGFQVSLDVPDAAADIVRLCAGSYERQGPGFNHDEARVAQWIETLQSAGQLRMATVTAEGEPTPSGGVAVLHDGHTAHYWVAGSVPGPAMTVLLGTLMPQLHADGLQSFDFVGANTPSIAEFKRRFNPILTPYYSLRHVANPALRMLFAIKGG